MYSCTMPVPGPGGPGGTCPHPHEEDVSVLFFFANSMGGVWGGFGCFNGSHDGYANRSNSQTSLPRAIGSPTDSRTVLPRAVG